jgi:hypothetical protein
MTSAVSADRDGGLQRDGVKRRESANCSLHHAAGGFKTMRPRSPREQSAWSLEKLIQAAQRTVESRRRRATSVAPPPPVTTQPRQADNVALGIVNFGRVRAGLEPLAKLPYLGPEQTRVERIDAVTLGAAIVQAGRVARGEVPVPLPTDPVARAIVVAGERARGPSPRATAIGPATPWLLTLRLRVGRGIMTRVLKSAALAASISAFAHGLICPSRAADVFPVTPPLSPFSWTEPYVAVNVGGGVADVSTTATAFGGSLTASETLTGIIGGGQVGFNWQTGPAVRARGALP